MKLEKLSLMKKFILLGMTGLFLASFVACSAEPEIIEVIKEVPVEKIIIQ